MYLCLNRTLNRIMLLQYTDQISLMHTLLSLYWLFQSIFALISKQNLSCKILTNTSVSFPSYETYTRGIELRLLNVIKQQAIIYFFEII